MVHAVRSGARCVCGRRMGAMVHGREAEYRAQLSGSACAPKKSRDRLGRRKTETIASIPSYLWFFENIGGRRIPVINISGGTEIIGCFLFPLPIQPLKPCTLGGPAPGMSAEVLDDAGNRVAAGTTGYLACTKPAPSMTRGVWGDPQRYIDTYLSKVFARPGVPAEISRSRKGTTPQNAEWKNRAAAHPAEILGSAAGRYLDRAEPVGA